MALLYRGSPYAPYYVHDYEKREKKNLAFGFYFYTKQREESTMIPW